MKDMFKMAGITIFFSVVLLGIAFVGEVAGLYTLPFRENLRREGFEHSRPVVEGHIEELGKLMADYNRLEGKALEHQDNEELVLAYHTSQKADIQLMWVHYDAIPFDVRDEVPLDI